MSTIRLALLLSVAGAVGAVTAYAVPSGQNPPGQIDINALACSGVLSPDTLLGSTGSNPPCIPRADASRPTVVQAGIVTTDASGNWSIPWAKPFASASPYINPQPINPSASAPYTCNVTSSTATTATGKCWMSVSISFPALFTTLANTVQQTFGTAATIQVRIAARDTTQ